MAFQFQPPATIELPRTTARPHRDDRFWSRIRRGKVGSTVLKRPDGTYLTVSYPTQVDIAEASAVYMGGHIYDVSAAEAAALTAAGYTVIDTTPVVPGEPGVIQTWDDLLAQYATWDEVEAAFGSWDELLS